MKRPPRTVVLAAALISGVAVAALILCTTLFLRSYRSAVVEGARTNSAQVVSQVAGAVNNYVNTMDSVVGIVLEQLDREPAMRDAFLNAFLTVRPEVAAITTYDENGSLLDCWAQAGRTPRRICKFKNTATKTSLPTTLRWTRAACTACATRSRCSPSSRTPLFTGWI